MTKQPIADNYTPTIQNNRTKRYMKKLILISLALVGFNSAANECSNENLSASHIPSLHGVVIFIDKNSTAEYLNIINKNASDFGTMYPKLMELSSKTCKGVHSVERTKSPSDSIDMSISLRKDGPDGIENRYTIRSHSIEHATVKGGKNISTRYITYLNGVLLGAYANKELPYRDRMKKENLDFELINDGAEYVAIINSLGELAAEVDEILSRP